MTKKIILLIAFSFIIIGIINAQWEKITGPYCGGNINCIAVNNTTILAGTGEGMFLSKDKGKSWKNIGLTNLLSVIIKDDIIFAGTYGGGIYRSMDNGASWTDVTEEIAGYKIVSSLSTDGSNIYAGFGGKGIYMSDDNGDNWLPINTGMENSDIRSILVRDSNIYAAARSEGIYKSSDNGKNWRLLKNGISHLTFYSMAQNDSTIYAGTMNGLFISKDNGESWISSEIGLTSKTIQAIATIGATIYAGTPGGIFKSIDNGQSWSLSNTGLFSPNVHDIKIANENIYLATTYDSGAHAGGLFLSTNFGDSWNILGVKDVFVWKFLNVGTKIYAGSISSGVFLSNDFGENWESINNGLTNFQIRSMTSNDTIILVGTEKGVFISEDYGESWHSSNQGIEDEYVKAVIINGKNIFAGTSQNGILLSTDYGSSWTKIDNELSNKTINSLAIIGSSIFAGTNAGIFKSSDNGFSWISANTGFPYTIPPPINSLTVIGETIYASTSSGLYMSDDLGNSWENINVNDNVSYIFSTIFESGSIFSLSPYSLNVSVDSSKSWSQINNIGMTNTDMRSICINGPHIFAAIADGGIYRRSLLVTAKNEISCTGASVNLNAIQAIGDSTNTTIKWSTGEISNHITVNPTTTTTYEIYAQNDNLRDTTQVTVTVRSLPEVVVDNGTICEGDSIIIKAKGARSYWWNNGDRNNWIVVKPDTTTQYMVIGTVEGIGCIDTAYSSVKVNSIPETPTIDIISDTLISSAIIGNQWYKDYYYIWGATDSNFIYTQNGSYYTIVTLNGCSSDTSNIINVTSVGVKHYPDISDISIYPNPVTDYIYIESINELTIQIFDLKGQFFQTIRNKNNKFNIDLRALPRGIYLMNIQAKNKSITRRFIKQ